MALQRVRRKNYSSFNCSRFHMRHLRWTPLHYAAYEGLYDAVDAILQQEPMSTSEWLRDTPYVDINARTAFGFTALHLAVLQDKVAIVETLLRNGVDLSIQDMYGWTALHFAVLHDPPEIELNLENDPLWTWIGHKELHVHDDSHLGLKYQKYLKQIPITFRKKTRTVAKAIIQLLLDYGADTGVQSQTICLKAFDVAYREDRKHNTSTFSLMLWKANREGTGINEQSVGEATRQNDEMLVWILLKNNYSPNDSTGGRSALYWACSQNNMSMVQLLVDHGARGDENGDREDHRYIPLHLAVERNDYDMIITLLRMPIDRDVLDDQGRTAYEISIKTDPGAYKIRNALLGFQDPPQAFNDRGQTWFHAVAEKRDHRVLRSYKFYGGSPDINLQDSRFRTLLFYAAEMGDMALLEELRHMPGHLSYMSLLLGSPADSDEQMTAMGIAAEKGHNRVAEKICRWIRYEDDPSAIKSGSKLNNDVPIVDLVLFDKDREFSASDAELSYEDDYDGRHRFAELLYRQESLYMPELLERSIKSEQVYATWFLLQHGCIPDVPAAASPRGQEFLDLTKQIGPFFEPIIFKAHINRLVIGKMTLLEIAARHDFPAVLKQLVSRGAQIHTNNFAALHRAIKEEREENALLLISLWALYSRHMSLVERMDLTHKIKLLPLAIWSQRVTVQLIENDFTWGVHSAIDAVTAVTQGSKRYAPALAILRAFENSRRWEGERAWRQKEALHRRREERQGWDRERDRRLKRWLGGEVAYPHAT